MIRRRVLLVLALVVAGLWVLCLAFLPGVPSQRHPHTIRITELATTTSTSSTSTTVAVAAPPVTHAPRPRASRAAPAPRPALGGDVWAALANCESHGNPAAVSANGRYFGAFQFALGTWHSLGYAGNPVDYPYEVQLEAAQRLVARSGWGQFPTCSRLIGAA